LIGIAGLHTERSAFVVSSSAVDAVRAGIHTPVALHIAGLAESILSEVVERTVLHAGSTEGESRNATGAVLGDNIAGSTGRVATRALVDGGLVESLGAVEGADASNHDVGALVITNTVVKDLS
jgi:hypothetical protein